MSDTRPLTCVISQFALACNLTTTYYLLTLDEGIPGRFFPLSMLFYAPLVYLFNLLFLRHKRTMLTLSVLNMVLGGLILAGYLLLEQWRGPIFLAFVGIFITWVTVRGCRFSLNGSPLRGTLLMLDCSFLLLIAGIGYFAAMGWEAKWSIPAICGLFASLIAAASSRTPRTFGIKGWLAVGTAFGLLILLIWIFVEVMAAPAGSGLIALWSVIMNGINAAKRLVFRFLTYLLCLLPNAEPGEMDWYKPPEFSVTEEAPVSETSPVVGVLILILAAACGIALLLWLVRHMGKLRLERIKQPFSVSKPHRKRISVLNGLLQMISRCIEEIHLRIRLWKERNTSVGLYFLLVHRCRRSPWRKQPGETPREFLLRMAGAARLDAELTQALESLAQTTDAALYSSQLSPSKPEYASMIRRRINAAVRKQFVLELLGRLRSRKT